MAVKIYATYMPLGDQGTDLHDLPSLNPAQTRLTTLKEEDMGTNLQKWYQHETYTHNRIDSRQRLLPVAC